VPFVESVDAATVRPMKPKNIVCLHIPPSSRLDWREWFTGMRYVIRAKAAENFATPTNASLFGVNASGAVTAGWLRTPTIYETTGASSSTIGVNAVLPRSG
jgi:hypothetical protein